jgi:dienelactone hydrolase
MASSTAEVAPELEARWARLAPHVAVFGPADDLARPAVLLFHGCGGVQSHLFDYAEAFARQGLRAFVVDSYAPRGWSRSFVLATVCTGLRFRGRARMPDLLAALWGVSRRSDVAARRLGLVGWSHGAWAITELMAEPLDEAGERLLAGVGALGLVYAYVGPGATRRPWRRGAATLAVVAERDHLASPGAHARAYRPLEALGHELEIWLAAASHAFDQPEVTFPMRQDAAATAECRRRLVDHFARRLAGNDPVA